MTDSEQQQAETARLAKLRALGFFPADYGAVEGGKLYVSGGYWSVLRFPSFPANLATMHIVTVIQVPFHEHQADHSLEIDLIDADEKPLGLKIEGSFRTAPNLESQYGEPGSALAAIPVQGLTFARPGAYSFTMKVDGTELARYAFSVIQVAAIAVPQRLPKNPKE